MLGFVVTIAAECARSNAPLDAAPAEATVVDTADAALVPCGDSACGPSQLCVHGYGTHGAMAPRADGAACDVPGAVGPTSRYGRCWNEFDHCIDLRGGCPSGDLCGCAMDASVECTCALPSLCQPCERASDQSVNCYDIGF